MVYPKNMPSQNPKISVITVCFNAAETLERTVQSVLSQTYDNFEYIIVDGKSTDGTLQIIDKYRKNITRFISEKDNGIYDAMNKGLGMATGAVIGILNADDFYEPETLQLIAAHYQQGRNIYHGHLQHIDQNGKAMHVNPAPKNLKQLRRGMIVNHPTVFVNREVYAELGGFSTDYRIASDWNFILKAYLAGVNFIRVDAVLSNFTHGGVSSSISDTYLKELHAIRKERGVVKSVDFFYLYDLVRFKLLGENLHRLYLLKKKILNA